MDVISILFLSCIVGQFATISHEFGHAIPALLFTNDDVKITIGNTVIKSKKIKFNRLIIEIGTCQPFLGRVEWSNHTLSKLKIIICSACGPMISLIIAISFIYLSGEIDNSILKKLISFSAYYHIWQFICTAIPIIYPKWWFGYGGYPSDGYYIISAIKKRNF